MTTFADALDWPTLLTAAGTAVATVLATVGSGVAWVLGHLAKQREAQRVHENGIAAKVDKLAADFQATAKDLARDAHETIKAITKDSREEARRTTSTLLEIQRETVEAVGGLGGRVSELATAIASLQHEMSRKADRNDRQDRAENRP